MSESQIGDEKDVKESIDVFPVDETPTPTRILKLAMANDLFPDIQDPKENPFDVDFRKAAEAAKSGAEDLSTSFDQTESNTEDESLNTPSIFPSSALNTPTPLRSLKTNTSNISPEKPKVHKSKVLKPILPNPGGLNKAINGLEEAQLFTGSTSVHNLKVVQVPTSGGELISTQDNLTDKPDQVNVNKNEAETAERRERNRYSARRSRIRKQRHYDELEKTQKVLMFENANLREEVTALKTLLKDHLACDVTRQNKLENIFRELLDSSASSQHSPSSERTLRLSSIASISSAKVIQAEPEFEMPTVVYNMAGETVEVVTAQNYQNKSNQPIQSDSIHPESSRYIIPDNDTYEDDTNTSDEYQGNVNIADERDDSNSESTTPKHSEKFEDNRPNYSSSTSKEAAQDEDLTDSTNQTSVRLLPRKLLSPRIINSHENPFNKIYFDQVFGKSLPTSKTTLHPRITPALHRKSPNVQLSQRGHLSLMTNTRTHTTNDYSINSPSHFSPTSFHATSRTNMEKSLLTSLSPRILAVEPLRRFEDSKSTDLNTIPEHLKLLPGGNVASCSNYNPVVTVAKHQPLLLPRPSPPQTVPQDLTTKKLPVPTTESSSVFVAPKTKRKSEEVNFGRPKKRGTLVQKLIDIKNKMSEDKQIDEFLQQIHSDR